MYFIAHETTPLKPGPATGWVNSEDDHVAFLAKSSLAAVIEILVGASDAIIWLAPAVCDNMTSYRCQSVGGAVLAAWRKHRSLSIDASVYAACCLAVSTRSIYDIVCHLMSLGRHTTDHIDPAVIGARRRARPKNPVRFRTTDPSKDPRNT